MVGDYYMDVRRRILTCRLIEKINIDQEYAEKLKIKNISYFNNCEKEQENTTKSSKNSEGFR